MAPPVTVDGLLRSAEQWLGAEGARYATDSPRLDAEFLLADVLCVSRAELLACLREPVSSDAQRSFAVVLRRRADGESVAYIVGTVPFLDVTLSVGPGVLVPRPETEALAQWAIARCRLRGEARPLRVLDVGTGSGALAVAIAHSVPYASVVATDIAEAAIQRARSNARSCDVAARVQVVHADLVPSTAEPFDIVVANLPYVGLAEASQVDPGVMRHEPLDALFADEDGLAQIRRLLSRLPQHMAAGADVGLEIGWHQGLAVLAMTRSVFGTNAVRLERDLAGHDRLVLAENVGGAGTSDGATVTSRRPLSWTPSPAGCGPQRPDAVRDR